MTTYYDILGVTESASTEEIQSAYNKQVKKYHPDKSDHPDSDKLFKDLQKSKENLPQVTRPIDYTLNYHWENGEPIEPFSEADENQDTEEDRDPWDSTNTADTDPNPNDKSNVNVEDNTHSTGSDTTQSSARSDDTDTRNQRDSRKATSQYSTGDSSSESTTTENSVGSTVWHKVVIGSTVTQAVYSVVSSSSSSLLIFATVLASIGLPVGIHLDAKKISAYADWPQHKIAYVLPSIIPVIAVIPGLLYLWRRSSNVTNGVTVSHDQQSTTDKVQSVMTRRNTTGAAVGGGLLFLLGNQSDETESGGSSVGNAPEEVTVADPSESIQDAINTVASGGTVIVNSGVYPENIIIEKDITIVSTEGATLEGSEVDVDSGISIETDAVAVDGLSVAGFYTGITGGSQNADITISNLELDNGNYGISVEANSLDLAEVTAREHSNSGVDVSSTRNGDVTVSNCIIETSGQETYADNDDGLFVEGANNILIEKSEFADNGDSSIVIEPGNVDGQSIEITDTVTIDSGNTGIYVGGTRGTDDIVISNVESTRDETGIWVGNKSNVANVEIRSVEMVGHRDNGIEIYSTRDGEINISDTFVDNDDNDAYADDTPLLLEGGQTITIEGSEFLSGTENNIDILSGSTNGQQISITNTDSASAHSGDGMTYEGSRGEDQIEIRNADIVNNDDYGIDIAGEQVTLENVTATGNGEGGLNLRDIERSQADITGSILSE